MFEKQHKQITGAALVDALSWRGLELVIGGNNDSDKLGTDGGGYHVQHFHFSSNDKVQDGRALNRKCKNYI